MFLMNLLKIISIMLYLSEDSVFLRDASTELRVGTLEAGARVMAMEPVSHHWS